MSNTDSTVKMCCRCNKTKPREMFATKTNGRPEGACKMCRNAACLIRYHKNRDRDREKINARAREWRRTHIEQINADKKANPEKYRERSRRHYRKNKTVINHNKNIEFTRRRRVDPAFKIKQSLRNRLNAVLGRVGAKKSKHCMELVGCSEKALVQHITSKFTTDMTWEKFLAGQIHIDHIRPCASFDLTEPEQQKACFHWSNLQPLWAKDNLRKGAKYENVTIAS